MEAFMNVSIVFLAGGSGTRLWPMSRTNLPKQLQKLVGDKTLIQQSYDRVISIAKDADIYIDTAEKYAAEIHKQLPTLPKENIIAEPSAKNTAAAVGLAAIHLFHKDPESIMVSLHSDHIVSKVDNFVSAISVATKAVAENPSLILTVGIEPTFPSTELGYIKKSDLYKKVDNADVFNVERFVEKPDAETAETFLATNSYYWNAGYFVWRVDMLLNLFKQYLPNTYNHLMKIESAIGTPNYESVLVEEYEQVDKEAVDVAILEKASKIAVVPADLGWSDIGTWSSLHDVLISSQDSNLVSRGMHTSVDTDDCLVYAHDKMIATVGLKNVIIVDTPDVLLVADKSKAKDVKKIIDKLKEEGKHHLL
jgi:mannose-1-phosphate guanylyltransferase